MKYLRLLTLRIIHSFYADQYCDDFEIIPLDSTVRLLLNQRCILKTLPNQVIIFAAAETQNKTLIPFNQVLTFEFQLYLHNAAFPGFTEISQMRQPLVFTNAEDADSGVLMPTFGTASQPVSPHAFARVDIQYRGTPGIPVEYEIRFEARQET